MSEPTPLRLQPGTHARSKPEAPAVVMVDSEARVTYGELESRSNQLAHLFRQRGFGPGDHLAVLLPNHSRYFEVVWAGLRAGLYVTPINWHLGPEEVGYIIEDSSAAALVTSAQFRDVVGAAGTPVEQLRMRLTINGHIDGFESYEDAVANEPTTRIGDETEGAYMFYSSGTTGRPKGIKPAPRSEPVGTGTALDLMLEGLYGFSEASRYLCPAPLYHAAPLGWSISTLRLGGTVFVMEKFDAERALAAIEEHRITKAQFVPTHFIRMLKLHPDVRSEYDVSSLETVIHAAAPCPVEVKQQMMDWWGDKIFEYYAGSEGNGFCAISPEEWRAHPGSVGKPVLGAVHILDEDGKRARDRAGGSDLVRERRHVRVPQRPREDPQCVQRSGVEQPR